MNNKNNFSKRLKNLITPDIEDLAKIFQDEFISVFDELNRDWKLNKDIDDLVYEWTIITSNNKEVASTRLRNDYKYNICICPKAAEYVFNNLKDKAGNKVYKTLVDLYKNAGAHEACHMIVDLLTNHSGVAKDHENMFRSIYEPIRLTRGYTTVPFEVYPDGSTNFSRDSILMSFDQKYNI